MTLFEAYQRVAAASPDQPAISYHRSPYQGTVLTWQGVVDRSRAIADKLGAAGVGSGDRCAVVMEDHPDIVPVVLAGWLRDAVVVPVDSAWGADITRSVLTLSGADVIIDAVRDTCTRNSWARPDRPALPPDTAMISYTSGSTSDPKGVVLTHGQLRHAYQASARQVRDLLGYQPSRFGVSMRMSGLGILGMNYLWPAVMGMPVAVLPELTFGSARRYWTDLRANGVDLTYLVPALVELLTRTATDKAGAGDKAAAGDTAAPGEMVVCLSGGAPLSAAAQVRFQERFRAILLNVYGLTEVSFAAFFGDRDESGRATLSIGRPATVSARLRGPDGTIVDGPGEGEIELHGPAMSCGYYDNPAANEDLIRDDWIRTGDLARRDEQGRYWITGRRKDVVLKGGFTVYLHEVEEVAGLLPGVLETAAVRLDLPTGEDIGLLVRPDPAAEVTPAPDDVQAELERRLGRQRAPRRVVLTEDPLPRLGQEKINRRQALARWERLTAAPQSMNQEPHVDH